MDRDTAWAAIKEIEAAGLLVRDKRGFRASNQYELIVPTGGNPPPIEAPQVAETFGTTGGNPRHQLAEEIRHQGYPLKVPHEGGGATPAHQLPSALSENQLAELAELGVNPPRLQKIWGEFRDKKIHWRDKLSHEEVMPSFRTFVRESLRGKPTRNKFDSNDYSGYSTLPAAQSLPPLPEHTDQELAEASAAEQAKWKGMPAPEDTHSLAYAMWEQANPAPV